MTEQAPTEAVEAAARANYERHFWTGGAWDNLSDEWRDIERAIVRPVVEAVAPYLAQPALRHVAAQPESGPHKPAMPEHYLDDATGKRYVLAQPARVVPSMDEVAHAIFRGHKLGSQIDPESETGQAIITCRCGEKFRLWAVAWRHVSHAVLALFASQPTVAEVREQVSEDILATARRYRLPKRDDESQTEFTLRLVRADVLSDAARIARGETKGDE